MFFRPLAILFALSATAAAPAQAAGARWTVIDVFGDVRVAKGGTGAPARRGAKLPGGAVIVTGPKARAVLARGPQYAILGQNSRLRVQATPTRTGPRSLAQMFTDAGTILFKVDKRRAQHFGVRTPQLAAVVKGTTFRVHAGAGRTSLGVSDGLVEVATPDGTRAVSVPRGRIATADPTKAKALLLAAYPAEAAARDADEIAILPQLDEAALAAAERPAVVPEPKAGFDPPPALPGAAGALGLALVLAVVANRRRRSRAEEGAGRIVVRSEAGPAGLPDPGSGFGPRGTTRAPSYPSSTPTSAGRPPQAAPFPEPVPEADADADPRRGAKRARVLLAGRVSFEGEEHEVRLRDLSRTGAVITGLPERPVGSGVLITTAHFRTRAEVLWAKEDRVGVRFDAELAESSLPTGKRPKR